MALGGRSRWWACGRNRQDVARDTLVQSQQAEHTHELPLRIAP